MPLAIWRFGAVISMARRPNWRRARDIFVRIGEGLGEANTLRSLGDLALRRGDLDGAKTQLEAARDIFVRIDDSLGEANTLRSLGTLALRRDDLDGAKTQLEAGAGYLHPDWREPWRGECA